MVEHAGWDDPISRAINENWRWNNPLYEVLVTIAEATHNQTLLVGNLSGVKKRDLLHIPRPGEIETSTQQLGGSPEPIGEIDDWLDDQLN